MRKDIESLRQNQTSNIEIIKNLNEKIKNLETENKNLLLQIAENLNKYNQEIQQRNEDLEFLKRAYDDQKNKVNREHELVNSSLYELTIQFMTLKNEMIKKTSGYFNSPENKVLK